MADLKRGTTINGQPLWHAGNDGPGSGLDADTVDGLNSTAFAPSQVAASLPAPRFVGDVGIDSDAWPCEWDQFWLYPLLINGWANYGGGYAPARFRRLMSGIVIVEGLVKSGSGVIFKMPTYYRPSYHFLTESVCNPIVGCRIQIDSDGSLYPSFVAPGDNVWVSINCWFYGV